MQMWVEKLIKEYNVEKGQLQNYRDKLVPALKRDKFNTTKIDELQNVEDMIGDMNFALNWMRSGRRPGSRRGVDQRGVYKRTELVKAFPGIVPDVNELTNEEKRKLVDTLMSLSARERQCFLLFVTGGLTYAEIADKLKVSRTSVQKFVERAKSKVQQGI